jgi:formylglycine-generating enzyme
VAGSSRILGAVCFVMVALGWSASRSARAQAPAAARCAPDMVDVGAFCIDRYEASMVDTRLGQPLSPYYPPDARLLRLVRDYWAIARFEIGDEAARAMPLPDLPPVQREGRFEPRAVSRPGVVPQAYVSYPLAVKACRNAGKRLCKKEEWLFACRGQLATRFPYGPAFAHGKCNVFRPLHPATVLHHNASIGHRDPRLNLIFENGTDPLLRVTGATAPCASEWQRDRIYDMVGNLDEWIDDENGTFVGGFYARSTSKGCEAEINGHAPAYFDYSTGVRCCK